MWITDPKTKEKSVSLTLFVISFLVALSLTIAESFEKVKSSSASVEIMYAMAALYFSRKVSIKGKSFSMENSQTKGLEASGGTDDKDKA